MADDDTEEVKSKPKAKAKNIPEQPAIDPEGLYDPAQPNVFSWAPYAPYWIGNPEYKPPVVQPSEVEPTTQIGGTEPYIWVPLSQPPPRQPSQVEPYTPLGGNPYIPPPVDVTNYQPLRAEGGFPGEPTTVIVKPELSPQQQATIVPHTFESDVQRMLRERAMRGQPIELQRGGTVPGDLSSAIDALEKSTPDQQQKQPRAPASLSDAIDALEISTIKEQQGEQPVSPFVEAGAAVVGGPLLTGLVQQPTGRVFLKSALGVGTQAVTGTLADAAAAIRAAGGDRLAGKELPEVQAERDRIVAEQADVQRRMQTLINSGAAQNNVDQLMALSSQNAELDRMKNENEEVLKSGQKKPINLAARAANVLEGGARGVSKLTPEAMERLLPTTQALDESPIGKIASGAGTIAAMVPLSLAGPEVEIPAFALIGSGAQYEDAIRNGASEDTAENSALLGAIGTVPQSLSMLPFMGMAQKLRGLTPTQAMTEIGKAAALGGVGGAGWGVSQNMVAILSGYDPNRPLDEGVYQQLLIGAGLGALMGTVSATPGLARFMRGADTEVRNRPPQPPETRFTLGAGAPPVYMGPTRPQPTLQLGAPTAPAQEPMLQLGAPTPAREAPTTVLPTGEPIYVPPGRRQERAGILPYSAEAAADVRRQSAQNAEQLLTEKGAPGSVERASAEASAILGEVAGAPQPVEAAPATPVVTPTEAPTEVKPAEVAAPVAEAPPRVPQRTLTIRYDEPNQSWYVERNGQPEARFSSEQQARDYISGEKPTAAPAPEAENFTQPTGDKKLFLNKGEWQKMPLVQAATATRGQIRTDENGDHWQAVVGGGATKVAAQRVDPIQPAAPAHVPQSNEPPALPSRRGEPVERENPDLQRRPNPAEVKQVTNDAASTMGLDQVVHYVPDAEALHDRVKKTLTDSERTRSAQTVWDNSMRELWVIGDRFDSVADLHRALIEETQGRLWRDVADVHFINDPNDNRLGYYDIARDRPVLNLDALMRTRDPFGNASKTAQHEIVVHKGISAAYGTREGAAYVQAMRDLQRNFNQSKLNDILAQEKGFKNLEDMAAAYGYENYATDPKQRNALTEELAGAFAERFKSREEIEDNAPRWYQIALKTLSDGIRRRFGMQVSPLTMQHLLADSMSALRFPKYTQPGKLMPGLMAQSKLDMAQNQLAALRGPEGEGGPTPEQMDFLKQMGVSTPPPPPPVRVGQPIIPEPAVKAGSAEEAAMRAQAAPPETANIGNLFVKQQMRETIAGMQPGQGVRAQPPKLAMQAERDLLNRMQFMEPDNLLYQKRGEELDTAEAQQLFTNVHGGDVQSAMQGLTREQNPTPVHAALREIVDRSINQQIDDHWNAGSTEAARALQLQRDQWNQQMQERVTGTAQELQAQKRFTDGSQEVGKVRAQMSRQQRQTISGKDVTQGAKAIGEQVRLAAQKMVNRLQLETARADLALWRKQMSDPTTLADRYIRSVAEGIDANFAKAGFNDTDRPLLQQLFNTFQQRIQEQIKEGASLPEAGPKATPPTATEKIRNMISNFDMFQRTWDATVDQLKTENPNGVFFANLEHAMGEPIGERGARAVIGEQNSMGDLIYKHYSTLNRINQNLGQTLTDNLGIDQNLAGRMQQRFDTMFRSILAEEQQGALKRILDSVQGKPGGRPAPNEVARLTDLLALGGFNKDEWINLLAPRYKLGTGWTPELIQGIKDAGDMLQRIRDEGNTSPVIRDRYEAQIADLLARSQTQGNILTRRIQSLWMGSLVTGFISHLGYAIQNGFNKLFTTYSHALETGDLAAFAAMHADAIAGFQRAIQTDIPYIMRTGISPVRELHGEGQFPFRSALEATPFEGRMAYLNNYKYVGRLLMALETFTIRGTEYAMQRVIATRLAHDMGYDGARAEAFADQAIYGTQEKVEQARREALADQTRWGFDDKALAVRQQEILDRLKTTSDNPDTAIADRETEALQSAAGESVRVGMHAALREDVPGALGIMSRLVEAARVKHPLAVSFVMPFNKLPMNLANEWLAWTPLGVWRGRDRITGGTSGIEGYYRDVPGFAKKVETGEISERELRSMAYEQFLKGMTGTASMALMGTVMGLNKDNPDPWFWVTADGPSTAGGKNLARAEGFNPYTIKLGNTRWSYQDSPLRGLFGILGGAGDYMRYESKTDDAGANFGAAVLSGAMHMGSIAVDTSSLQGVANLVGMFAPGQSAKERETRLENFVANFTSSLALVPVGGTLVRQAYRMVDPRQFEAHDPSSIFIRNIPVVNGMFLQPKLNVLGEPVTNSPLARLPFLPIGETGGTLAEGKFYTTDPVWQYIEQTGLHLQLPGNSKKIDGVAISPAELHVYHEARGKALKEALADAFQDPDFTSQSMDDQDKQVKSEFEKAADEAGVEAVLDYREKRGGK